MNRVFLLLVPLAMACAPEAPGERSLDRDWDALPVSDIIVFTTIQDAIDSASSGDTVTIPAGTYYEDLNIDKSITVAGVGQGETLLVGTVDITGMTETTLSGIGITSPTFVSDGTWYTTEAGVYVDGDGGIVHVRDVGVQYFEYGIYSIGSAYSVIGEVTAAYNEYGIYTEYDMGHTIQNSLVHSNAISGIRSTYSTGTIAHNTLWGNGFGSTGSTAGAIGLGSGDSTQVLNNVVTSNDYGLNCSGSTSSTSHNLV